MAPPPADPHPLIAESADDDIEELPPRSLLLLLADGPRRPAHKKQELLHAAALRVSPSSAPHAMAPAPTQCSLAH